MNKSKKLIFALVAMLAVSCVADPATEGVDASTEASLNQKIVNTSKDAVRGELIVCVDALTAESFDEALSATRSGVTDFDAIAEQIGATSIEHIFNMKGNQQRIKEHGLDRWFLVKFSEDVDLQIAANKLSSVNSINLVEFNTRVARPNVAISPVDESEVPVTRAGIDPFDDMMLSSQWHYNNTGSIAIHSKAKAGEDINLYPAWELTAGRPEIIVAVVDEGVDYTHPDLAANMWVNQAELTGTKGVDDDNNGYVDDIHGYNFAGGGEIGWNDANDLGHGTHVAGTIAAVNNNDLGVCGVAGGTGQGDGVRMMSCQIFDGSDYGSVTEIAKAIQYAADNGASVMNCSWGVPVFSIDNDDSYAYGSYSAVRKACEYFQSGKNSAALNGNIAIFAAGNEGLPCAAYPGAYNEYICVTAFAPDGLPTYFTNYDKGCNVAAPGGEMNRGSKDPAQVLSTLRNGQYGYAQGTSMACPHVSGIAALALSYALDLGIELELEQLKGYIVSCVNDIDSSLNGTRDYYGGVMQLSSYYGKMGTGKIDAYQVLMAVRGTLCIPLTVGENSVDIDSYLGDGNIDIKMLNEIEISDATREALGIEGDISVKGENLYIKATKPGCGTAKLFFIAGGNSQGGGRFTGGMRFEREVAFIVRPNNDNGGWL